MLPDRSRKVIPGFDSRHSAAEYHAAQLISQPLRLGRVFCCPKSLGEIEKLSFFALTGLNALFDQLDQDTVCAETPRPGDGPNLLGYGRR